MRRLAVLAIAIAIGSGCAGDHAAPPGDHAPLATSFPIEVLGAPGVAVAATVDVPPALAGAPELGLELTVSNIVAVEAAYVSVNGGTPIDLGADATALRRPSGGTARGTIALPAGAVRAGLNTLLFT